MEVLSQARSHLERVATERRWPVRRLRLAAATALCLSLPVLAAPPEAPTDSAVELQVPRLSVPARLDGKLGDLATGLELVPLPVAGTERAATKSAPLPTFKARVGARKDGLQLGVEVVDAALVPGDHVRLTLHFPGAGLAARGVAYELGFDGRSSGPEQGSTVKSAVARAPKGFSLEVALPLAALPRLPASGPLRLELCVSYVSRERLGGPESDASNCQAGSMVKAQPGPGAAPAHVTLLLPPDLRPALKPSPPDAVKGLEARPQAGWAGYDDTSTLPIWLWREKALPATQADWSALASPESVDPTAFRIPLPSRLALPGGEPLRAVVAGKWSEDGNTRCSEGDELTLGLYRVRGGNTAEQVLEWPAASCKLGRAVSVELNEEGELTLGYSGGPVIRFVWGGERFDRTELGLAAGLEQAVERPAPHW